MSNFFKNRRTARRLAKVGSIVDTTYLVYVNNNEPVTFPSKQTALSYIKEFRDNNVIFKLQIYRVESYSL